MIGILLITMGSPDNPKEMRNFLFRLFCDASIFPHNKLFRYIFAYFFSNLHYKKSWKKYELIGGSPLKKSMNVILGQLMKELENCIGYCAFSYDTPLIHDGIKYLYDKNVKEIIIIPMYPQYSISTTGSVIREILKMRVKYKDIAIRVADEFYENKIFIEFWDTLIRETMQVSGLCNPLLIFSAHSIPEFQAKEDSYINAIETSAYLISLSLGLKYLVSYQSKIGKVKWKGPGTKETLKKLADEGEQDIIIVPISFLNENLETLYDLDHDIVPYAKEKLKIWGVCRVIIPESHPLMIQLLKNIIR